MFLMPQPNSVEPSVFGITFGAFDLLHAGHLIFLKQASDKCDHLTVGLHVNPRLERFEKNRPVQSLWERFEKLNSLKFVDIVIPYELNDDIIDILHFNEYQIRFLGTDYVTEEKPIIGENLVPITYLDRYHGYSSSDLRKVIAKTEENGNFQ